MARTLAALMALLGAATAAQAQAHDKARANSYDDAWEAGWVAHGRSVYRTAAKTTGFVLQVGDSITHSNPSSQWPRSPNGATTEDLAAISWCLADVAWPGSQNDTSSKNGWYLACADTSGIRGMCSGSGLDTIELTTGGGNGGTTMPMTSDPAAARTYVADGTTYSSDLQIHTVAAAFQDAQYAVLMIGTNDMNAGRDVDATATNVTSIVDALEAQNVVVVLSTIPPHFDAAKNANVVAYNDRLRTLAQTRGLPLIDYYAEILARRPGTSWNGTLLGLDDLHPSASGGGYSSSSDPYVPGGDSATHATGDACLNVGYLLRSWLTIQKLKEVKSYVSDGNNPPASPPPVPPPAPP
ncbi:MAG: SGNH/GDSL hydrolase family protein, partial [Actinomycetota bacterium]